MKRIAFLCSGQGRVFERICQEENVMVCVIDRICPSMDVAARYDVPVRYIPRRIYADRESFSDDILKVLQRFEIDAVCTTFDSLLTGKILETYRDRIINFHPSLLPAFSGTNAVQRTLESGVEVGGVTIHVIDESIDGGRILAQAKIPTGLGRFGYGMEIYTEGVRLLLETLKELNHDV